MAEPNPHRLREDGAMPLRALNHLEFLQLVEREIVDELLGDIEASMSLPANPEAPEVPETPEGEVPWDSDITWEEPEGWRASQPWDEEDEDDE